MRERESTASPTKSHQPVPQVSHQEVDIIPAVSCGRSLTRPQQQALLLTLPEMSVWELMSRYCFGSGKPELSRELLLDHRSEWDPLSVRKPSFSIARL